MHVTHLKYGRSHFSKRMFKKANQLSDKCVVKSKSLHFTSETF